MKTFQKIVATSVLLITVIIPLLFSSCKQNDPEFYTMWFTDPETYRTNELEVAQRETPFTILLPKYVPGDLIPFPFIQGPSRNIFDDALPIRIMYYRNNESFNPILIEEYNTYIIRHASDNSSYLNISGVEILEESITMLKDITNFVGGFNYSWNNNNIHYNVAIAEYQIEECRKIIKSMITD